LSSGRAVDSGEDLCRLVSSQPLRPQNKMYRLVSLTGRSLSSCLRPNAPSSPVRSVRQAGRRSLADTPHAKEAPWTLSRYLNPWPDMSRHSSDAAIHARIETYSTTFGIVSALMFSISAAAVVSAPPAATPAAGTAAADPASASSSSSTCSDNVDNGDGNMTGCYLDDLSIWWAQRRLSKFEKDDIYFGCVLTSLYSSMCSLGLSTASHSW